MKLLRQIRALIIINCAVMILMTVVNFVEYISNNNDAAIARRDTADLQRSVGSYDYLLNPLLFEYGASRVVLYRIRDDNANAPVEILANLSNIVMTTVTSVSTRSENAGGQKLIRVPVGIYTEVLPQLLIHQPVFFKVIDMKNGPLREMLISRDVAYALWVDVSDVDGNMIGILGIGWRTNEAVPTDKKFQMLLAYAHEISTSIARNFSHLAVDRANR